MPMPVRTLVPPIKSQGIKTKLVPLIENLVPEGFRGRWIEPFMGTGVVGFNVSKGDAVMCDTNPHIVQFYTALNNGGITASDARSFLEHEGAALLERGADHYYAIRTRFNESHHPLDFLFLSRAGFNGMIRFNRSGGFNVPFCRKPQRFARAYVTKIVNQVEAVSAVLQKHDFEFRVQDFEGTIAGAVAGDIIYCDPPYAGRHNDYYNAWSDDDDRRLSECLKQSPASFVLSTWCSNRYRENTMLTKHWSDTPMLTMEHYYHVGGKIENRGSIIEALVHSPDIARQYMYADEPSSH